MSWVAVAVGGGSVLGAGASLLASNKQAASGRAAIGEMQREFDTIQSELAPYRAAGLNALNTIQDMLTPGKSTDIMSMDPGYQFRLSQGTGAVESSAAARGTQLSGATLKELLEFGQNYASGEFQNVFNRNLSVANLGAGATNTSAATGTSTAANIANTQTGIGNAQAAGIVGAGNAIGSAGNTLLLSSILGKTQTTNQTTPLSSPSQTLPGAGDLNSNLA